MIPALARFVDALRREGVRASPGEVLDAARAAEAVGPEGRERFRAALRATLVKQRAQIPAFDRTFDRFFAPPARSSRKTGEASTGAGEGGKRATQTGEGRRRAERERPERRPGGEARRPSAEGERDEVRRALRAARDSGERREGRLRTVRSDARRPGDAPPEAVRTDVTRSLPAEEERRLARLVPRLVEELRLRPGRRMRRARGGRVWMRRAFRENLSRGGVPFVLPHRRARLRRPRVVLLVDVSYSTAAAAGYFLWMAGAFLDLSRRARVLLFVDRPVDATAAVRRWAGGKGADAGPPVPRPRSRRRPGAGIAPGPVSFADLLESLRGLNLDAPSDYGRAFHALLRSAGRPAGRDTVLVVLGDGRTNRFDPLPWALEEVARGCRTVLWLVPEPEARWGTGDSALGAYLASVDVAVEARDLAGLARGLRELLRRL